MPSTKSILNFLVSVLITGGHYFNTAELFLPSTGTSCTLPALPEARYYHTSDNNILCGGERTGPRTSCIQLSPDDGTWKQLLTLDLERYCHVSWTPESGIGTYLMGGHILHLPWGIDFFSCEEAALKVNIEEPDKLNVFS